MDFIPTNQTTSAFNNVRLWALEDSECSGETLSIAAKIYRLELSASSNHDTPIEELPKKRQRDSKGAYNKHGGSNKILNEGHRRRPSASTATTNGI